MIRYEVTLQVKNKIEKAFSKWLEPHVKKMLEFDGFSKATIHYEASYTPNYYTIIICYSVDSINNLKYYFNNNSTAMRNEGLNAFPGQFTAMRKIFDGDLEINL